jgi:hypothetical protein
MKSIRGNCGMGGLLIAALMVSKPAQAAEGKVLVLGHTAATWSTAWSPDSKRLVSGANDHTDGRFIAGSSPDSTVRIWKIADEPTPTEKAREADEPGDYLTKDGKLKQTLTLRKDTVGLTPTAPKGEVWVIQPTGEWTSKVAGEKGKLSAKQLAALAQHLATQDFNSLPRTLGYKQQAIDEVYQRVAIDFGQKSATFHFKIGESPLDYLPKPGDPQAAAWSRFVALERVLIDLIESSQIKDKK